MAGLEPLAASSDHPLRQVPVGLIRRVDQSPIKVEAVKAQLPFPEQLHQERLLDRISRRLLLICRRPLERRKLGVTGALLDRRHQG